MSGLDNAGDRSAAGWTADIIRGERQAHRLGYRHGVYGMPRAPKKVPAEWRTAYLDGYREGADERTFGRSE